MWCTTVLHLRGIGGGDCEMLGGTGVEHVFTVHRPHNGTIILGAVSSGSGLQDQSRPSTRVSLTTGYMAKGHLAILGTGSRAKLRR